jgi:hypothetical protein
MNQELLLKIKKYRIPFKEVNQKIAVEYLSNWKKEYVDISEINEMVARQLLYRISEDLFGGVEEIEFKNWSKKPKNHFQMVMYLGEYILNTSPFIYVNDKHIIIPKNTKIEILNYDYDNVVMLKEDMLKGGKSDKLSLKQIADKFDVSIEKIKSQIQKGIKIEMEHTSDKEKAREIATDHISEFPDYYDRLGKMEKKAEKQWELNETKKFIKQRLRENLESTHIEIDKDYGYCVGNVHNDTAKIMNWFSFRKFDFTKYEKYLKKPVAFLNNIYVEADKKGMGFGNELYSEFEEECYSNDAKCIVLECDTGNEQNEGFDLKKWYESFDYEVIGVERGYPIMIKYLS